MGADPNALNHLGTPIIFMLFNEGGRDRRMLDLLLRYGADINARPLKLVSSSDIGSTPIMWASQNYIGNRPFDPQDEAMIRYMRDRGAEVWVRSYKFAKLYLISLRNTLQYPLNALAKLLLMYINTDMHTYIIYKN